jgi:hypothetical protein
MGRWWIAAVVLLAAYIAYPYLTLYWIDQALLTDDPQALRQIVDFPKIRDKLKNDVKLALIDKAQTQAGKGKILGIFGAALTALLVPTLVDSTIDEMVTPEAILDNPVVVERRREKKSFADFVTYAFFSAPTAFSVDLKDPNDPNSPTLTARMELLGPRWRVTAVKLPPIETWFASKKTSADVAPEGPE